MFSSGRLYPGVQIASDAGMKQFGHKNNSLTKENARRPGDITGSILTDRK